VRELSYNQNSTTLFREVQAPQSYLVTLRTSTFPGDQSSQPN
jgi:hypothetical protein